MEGAEYLARREDVNILVELRRIGARQFPWQRGYVGLPPLYRSAFIYGQGECAAYLQQAANLTPSDMTLVGFSLLSVFYPEPGIRPATDMDLFEFADQLPESGIAAEGAMSGEHIRVILAVAS